MKIKEYQLGQMLLQYMIDEKTGHVSMILLPEGERGCFEQRRSLIQQGKNRCSAWEIGNLCHLSLRHHEQGNGAGCTLKYGKSAEELRYQEQNVSRLGDKTRIETLLQAEEGYEILHRIEYTEGEQGIEVETLFRNRSGRTVTLDMISSFSLDNLSPFQKDDAPYKLKLHRFRGGWSLEGKHVENTVEELNLESPWLRAFPESERYGGIGSHPVKRWFPFGCVEDTEHHVFWAAQLGCNCSWQMEFSRDGDCYSLSGGLADCEFGGWWKNIADGECFCTPKSYISVSGKGLWDVCQNITDMFHKYADQQPIQEQGLPIIFNEWCTTWGEPSQESIRKISERVEELPVSYVVIDAGWSEKRRKTPDPQEGNGDWIPDREKFPEGLHVLSEEMQQKGQSLGIWMEFEVTTRGAKIHEKNYDFMHLYRNGEIIQTGKIRRFLDFRKAETRMYLKEKVIQFLRENGILYLKVDYNGSIGVGCDGAESPGEGLRAQMDAVLDFFWEIRRELPKVVIENCASGGHRLEPSMMEVTAMSSFSDAHECREIPYIAANLHALILPRQSQIWAVISPELSAGEIRYRLVSAMLGRFCLSGNILELDRLQWEEVKKAAIYYEKVKEIIKHGRSELIRRSTDNQHHLKGCQALVRIGENNRILIVYHSFEGPNETLRGTLPEKKWIIEDYFGKLDGFCLHGSSFEMIPGKDWEAYSILLKAEEGEGNE